MLVLELEVKRRTSNRKQCLVSDCDGSDGSLEDEDADLGVPI